MNPFDYSKAVTDFWTAQGQALMRAQEQAGKALAEGMKGVMAGKFPVLPEMPADLSSGAAELVRASKSVMELWSAATSICAKLAASVPTGTGGDGVVEATFRKVADPRSWIAGSGEMDEVLGRMAEGPRFADLWEVERRYAGVLRAWMNLSRRRLEHNAVVLEAWLQAGRRFTEQLAGQAAPDAKPLDAKAALNLWTETANRQLLETQRSEPFLQSQAAMIRATTDLRIAQQDLVEHFGKQYGFPTRTELDDVHRTVTELRREMRAMRREQRMLAVAPPPVLEAEPTEPARAPAEAEPSVVQAEPAVVHAEPAVVQAEPPAAEVQADPPPAAVQAEPPPVEAVAGPAAVQAAAPGAAAEPPEPIAQPAPETGSAALQPAASAARDPRTVKAKPTPATRPAKQPPTKQPVTKQPGTKQPGGPQPGTDRR